MLLRSLEGTSERLSEKLPAHCHYIKLQDATQENGKSSLTGVGDCVKRLLEMWRMRPHKEL